MFYAVNFKKYKKKLLLLSLLCLIFFLCFFVINFVCPFKHFSLIKKYADEYNLDPALICSIIHTESKFKTNAISHKGASGLMQIREATANWAAKEIGITDYSYKKIFQPEINIQIGCWYIRNLLNQFKSYKSAICAYNAGSGNVTKWLSNPKYSVDGKNLSYIPFNETRNYLKKVERNKNIYNLLIGLIIFNQR